MRIKVRSKFPRIFKEGKKIELRNQCIQYNIPEPPEGLHQLVEVEGS